jgi:hypothetical protein
MRPGPALRRWFQLVLSGEPQHLMQGVKMLYFAPLQLHFGVRFLEGLETVKRS